MTREYGYVEWDGGNTVSGSMYLEDAINYAELSHGKFIRCDPPVTGSSFNIWVFSTGVILGAVAFFLGQVSGL